MKWTGCSSHAARRLGKAGSPRGRIVVLRKLAIGLAMIAQHAWGAQCSVGAQGVNFGSYDTFTNQSLDSTGIISVICDVSTSYTISLSPGAGSYSSRVMSSGAHVLNYNLYTDPARTSVWGDGTGTTAVVSGSATTANHTLYARIPARQNAHLGSYSDAIVVTLNY